MSYKFQNPDINNGDDPIIIDEQGYEKVFVRIDDVWGPKRKIVADVENAKFILAILNGEDPVSLPRGATPGPWKFEHDQCAAENGDHDSWALVTGSPEGLETLALFDSSMFDEMLWVAEATW